MDPTAPEPDSAEVPRTATHLSSDLAGRDSLIEGHGKREAPLQNPEEAREGHDFHGFAVSPLLGR